MDLSKYLENSECVSTHSKLSNFDQLGLYDFEICLDGEDKTLTINTGEISKTGSYVFLSGDDFSIKISKTGLRFWLRDDTVEKLNLDKEITEEWFFQLCTLYDFASLRYSDIEFSIDVFNNLCTGE